MTVLAVDAWAVEGAASFRGVGTYTRHLLDGLVTRAGPDLVVLAPPSASLPAGIRRVDLPARAPGRWQGAEHEWRLAWGVHRTNADVLFEPSPAPPRRAPMPVVQTLHDVIPLVAGDPALAEERRRWRRWAPRYRRAAAVVAVSRHSADVGIATLGLDPAKVQVIPHGVGAEFTPDGPKPPSDKPYLLVVGEPSARKGFADAFGVVAALADAGYPHVLRVAGRIAPWVRPEIERLVAQSRRPDRVELLGYVDDLPALYRGAAVFIGCSRYEGFGLPALEAMACAVPVVAYANSATPEVVGDGGVLVEDGDQVALLAAVRSVIDQPNLAVELAGRAQSRAAQFSWSTSIDAHLDLLRAVAG